MNNCKCHCHDTAHHVDFHGNDVCVNRNTTCEHCKPEIKQEEVSELKNWKSKLKYARGYGIPEGESFMVFDYENIIWTADDLVAYVDMLLKEQEQKTREEERQRACDYIDTLKHVEPLGITHATDGLMSWAGQNRKIDTIKNKILNQ